MASVQLVPERTTYARGDLMVFRATYTGLNPGTPATSQLGTGTIHAELPDGSSLDANSVPVTVTRPGTPPEVPVSETVTFRLSGSTAALTLTKRADGAFTGTAP